MSERTSETAPDGGKDSATKKVPDLTSTIHLSALRSVRNQRNIEEIFASLGVEDRAVISQLPRNSAMLVVIAGPNRGSRYLIKDEKTRIGRDIESEILLDDVTVSRKHAVIERSTAGFLIRDLGSLNGTYVNSQPLLSEELIVGDEIHIGKFRLTYFSGKGNL